MTCLDLLSDTVYREQAVKQLDELLERCGEFPVQRTQICGLRQIARQEPGKVGGFADHQRGRAEREAERASDGGGPRLHARIEFWTLVGGLCDSTSVWSLDAEGSKHMPPELRDENIPAKRKGMTHDERRYRNQLMESQKEWLAEWNKKHLPAFFERFCAHALYLLEMSREVKGVNRR